MLYLNDDFEDQRIHLTHTFFLPYNKQAFASIISHSLALMGDSSTMFLDSITSLNYWLEIQKEKKTRSKRRLEWIEIYVSGLSIIILLV